MYNLSYLIISGEPIYVILLHLHLELASFKALFYACVPRFCVHFRVTFCPMIYNNFDHGLKKKFYGKFFPKFPNMKILLTDEARRAKYISRILKLHFSFTFPIRASNVVKT